MAIPTRHHTERIYKKMCIFQKKKFEMYPETCRLSGGYYQDLAGGYIESEGEHRSAQWKHKAEKEARNREQNEQARQEAKGISQLKKVAEH